MGLQATSIAAGAIGAQVVQAALRANNAANVNTPGYRAREARFSSVAGGGVRVASTSVNASFGSLIVTGSPLDVAVGGAGFLAFSDTQGIVLSRNGSLSVNAEGGVVDGAGRALFPALDLPQGAENVRISPNGDVIAQVGRERQYVGSIELATVANPRGLVASGETSLRATTASGVPVFGAPGSQGFGRVIQGALESSNVDLASEVAGTVIAKRAFSANLAVLRVADQITQETIDLVGAPDAQDGEEGPRYIEVSQAAGLRERVGERISAEPLSQSVRARLNARRLSIPQVFSNLVAERDHLAERFNKNAGGVGSGDVRGQELLIAQRQAAQARGVALDFEDAA